MVKRKICVVTGTRAEYGLLYWLLREIDNDPDLELQLVVTGAHLSPEFGLTYQAIENDGFTISEKVEMLLSSDTAVGITKSMGLATIGFADAFERLKPDILVLLGDRYEILSAAQAAMVAKIPIAHLHGGETTEGAIDEAIRHSITKMSHFHFVSAEPYKKRVIQLGEDPSRVHNFGALSIDNVKKLKLLEQDELEQSIGFKLGELSFLVTYHPVTLSVRKINESVNELLKALSYFDNANIIFTKPNADTHGRIISQMIEKYVEKQRSRMILVENLGLVRYLSALKYINVVIGNSSSGIVEAPLFYKPTVNIGDRQKGRLRLPSIIDCEEKEVDIINAIKLATSEEFLDKIRTQKFPYGNGTSSTKIKEYLKTVKLKGILSKKFYDL